MQYDEPQREAYNRMTLEGMRWSWSKVDAIRASMTQEEHLLDYVFPLLRYHSRWTRVISVCGKVQSRLLHKFQKINIQQIVLRCVLLDLLGQNTGRLSFRRKRLDLSGQNNRTVQRKRNPADPGEGAQPLPILV